MQPRHTSWTDAPGYEPCETCLGVGGLLSKPQVGNPMFADCDQITLMGACTNPLCQSGRQPKSYWLNEKTDPEELQNFRDFARTLPTEFACRYTADYICVMGREREKSVTCEIERGFVRYEGTGISDAAAYGRMIQAIVEREA